MVARKGLYDPLRLSQVRTRHIMPVWIELDGRDATPRGGAGYVGGVRP